MEKHFGLLKDWNERINLVSRKSFDKVFGAHYADCIFISDFARAYILNTVHDVGTGAGFPGIVFAIRFPEIFVHLYERSQKKRTFLAVVVAQLGLSNVSLHNEIGGGRQEGLFTARAVFPPEKLFAFARGNLRRGEILIVNQGGKAPPLELDEAFQSMDSRQYVLPDKLGERRVTAVKLIR